MKKEFELILRNALFALAFEKPDHFRKYRYNISGHYDALMKTPREFLTSYDIEFMNDFKEFEAEYNSLASDFGYVGPYYLDATVADSRGYIYVDIMGLFHEYGILRAANIDVDKENYVEDDDDDTFEKVLAFIKNYYSYEQTTTGGMLKKHQITFSKGNCLKELENEINSCLAKIGGAELIKTKIGFSKSMGEVISMATVKHKNGVGAIPEELRFDFGVAYPDNCDKQGYGGYSSYMFYDGSTERQEGSTAVVLIFEFRHNCRNYKDFERRTREYLSKIL